MDDQREQFSRIYQENLEKIYRFIYLKVDSRETAEDVTSKVFLRAWEAFQRPQNEVKNPTAFLYQIARNALVDHYRAQGRAKTVPLDNVQPVSDGTDTHSQAMVSAEVEAIKAVVQKLKKDYQDVIIWHYLEDMDIAEIAQLLNKPAGTVRVTLHRGLKELRRLMKKGSL